MPDYFQQMQAEHRLFGLNAVLCIAVHELGHALAAKAVGCPVQIQFGDGYHKSAASAVFERPPGHSDAKELFISVAAGAFQHAYVFSRADRILTPKFVDKWVLYQTDRDFEHLVVHYPDIGTAATVPEPLWNRFGNGATYREAVKLIRIEQERKSTAAEHKELIERFANLVAEPQQPETETLGCVSFADAVLALQGRSRAIQ